MTSEPAGSSPANKAVAFAAALVLIGLAAYSVYSFFGGDLSDDFRYSTYICTETGKAFRHLNQVGDVHPIPSPYSGKNTGVMAEACYWSADGSAKPEPTWVLLNELAGKPGPTFCPDCGRLVVGHNPQPGEGVRPPPTKQEHAARAPRRGPAAREQER